MGLTNTVYLKQKCNLILQFATNIVKKMFKFKSYNVSKAEKKSETGNSNSSSSSSSSSMGSSSYSTGTLKKTTTSSYVSPKVKTKPSATKIKEVNNYEPPEYSKKIYPKKTVTDWKKNDTYSAKNKTANVVIPSPKKKLERK